MNRHAKLVAAVSTGMVALIGIVAPGQSRAGELSPPAGPVNPTGPTVITQLPFDILEPGHYVLNGNLIAASGQDGIRIGASGVTIDLRGFAMSGAGGAGTGITLIPLDGGEGIVERRGVLVKNGSLLGWPDAGILTGVEGPEIDDAAMFSSSTFQDLHIQGLGEFGVEAGPVVANFAPIANTFERLSVNGMSSTGIDSGFSAVVRECKVTECDVGIIANEGRVSGCYVAFSATVGISGFTSTIDTSVSIRNGTFGISAQNSLVRGNTSRLNGSGSFQNLGTNITPDNRF